MKLSDADLLTPAILVAALALIALAASFAEPAIQRVVTETFIYVLVVVGLYLFSGISGVVSFGHVSFMVIGAYVSALLTLPPEKKAALLDLPPVLAQLHCSTATAALMAGGAAGMIALIVGLPLMRLRGVAPSMGLFALLMITHVVAQNWKAVTGGRQALVGLPLDTTLWTAFGAAAFSLVGVSVFQQSRWGAMLRCTRENEIAAESIGINIARERIRALVPSAMLCALGGALFAHFLGTLNPNTFYLDTTFLTLAMLVVGGLRSLSGAVAGVLILSAISEFFRALEQGVSLFGRDFAAPIGLQEVALALIMLTILILRPEGLLRGAELGQSITRRFRAQRGVDTAARTTF